MATTRTYQDEKTQDVVTEVRYSYSEVQSNVAIRIERLVAESLAEMAVKEMLPEIIARIDPQAIANMAIASAGAKINETLNKKMPDKVIHEEHLRTNNQEVWQRGLFGGLKRIR